MARLDTQKAASRRHQRFNHRFYVRGYNVLAHDVWGDWGQNKPTGATAGTPGSFSPAGSQSPFTLAQLRAWAPTPSPGTAWTTGQRVVLGDGTTAHWNGTTWVAGNAP